MVGTRNHIRWMVRRDMAEVCGIAAATPDAWSEDDFLRCLRESNRICFVIEVGQVEHPRVGGYMLIELHPERIELLNLAVAPDMRGQGLGRQLIRHAQGKLAEHRRWRLTTRVRERNTAALLFLRSQGFRATGLLRGHYEGEDAVLMQYCLS